MTFQKNEMEINRQKQMIRLLDRYKNIALLNNTWILQWCWEFSYLHTEDPRTQHTEEFFCNTNNMAFALMIFEAQKLPLKISIFKAEFKSKVDL